MWADFAVWVWSISHRSVKLWVQELLIRQLFGIKKTAIPYSAGNALFHTPAVVWTAVTIQK